MNAVSVMCFILGLSGLITDERYFVHKFRNLIVWQHFLTVQTLFDCLKLRAINGQQAQAVVIDIFRYGSVFLLDTGDLPFSEGFANS